MSYRKLEFIEMNEELQSAIGRFICFFASVEHLIGEIIFLLDVGAQEYESVKNMTVTSRHHETIRKQTFSIRLEKMKAYGFDVSTLRAVGDFRNGICHGYLISDGENFELKNFVKNRSWKLTIDEINNNLTLLEKEGASLLNFLEKQGFNLADE